MENEIMENEIIIYNCPFEADYKYNKNQKGVAREKISNITDKKIEEQCNIE
jgi:hypothetical protein